MPCIERTDNLIPGQRISQTNTTKCIFSPTMEMNQKQSICLSVCLYSMTMLGSFSSLEINQYQGVWRSESFIVAQKEFPFGSSDLEWNKHVWVASFGHFTSVHKLLYILSSSLPAIQPLTHLINETVKSSHEIKFLKDLFISDL